MKKFNLEYIPGNRPTPMLALYNEKNINVFNDIKSNANIPINISFNQTYVDNFNHAWNHAAYIIYDNELNIIAFTYSEISNLFFILRALNKKLILEFDATEEEIKKELKDWVNEVSFTFKKKTNNVINILDSSTKKIIGLNNDSINIYLCGPTVYNHVHIGNIRPIITYDVLHRYLKYKKVNVKFVHNITDIDDKIIIKSAEMNMSEKELSEMFFEHYKTILKQLNILPVEMPKVSENMEPMIEMIQELIRKKYAYEVNGNVYFSIKDLKIYGTVSSMEIDKLNDGERVDIDLNKMNKHDFVLWKNTTDGIKWESPMGAGRPGWHTECCVLINKYIGKQVDIHGGGIDLRFPHHENENIQNVARYGLSLAKIWMHTGHLMIEEQKMSKSLNNFVLAKDLINKSDSNSVRWMFYQARYEKPINYVSKILDESQKKINQIERDINKAYSYLILNNAYSKIEVISEEILNLLNDNLNLPNIVTIVYDKIKLFSSNISSKNFKELNKVYNDVKNTLDILGIFYPNVHTNQNIELIKKWNQYLIDKKFKEADEIRERLIIMKLI